MRLNKTTSILVILMMVLAVGTPSGLEGKSQHNGSSVDTIYQRIRNAVALYEWEESFVTFENEGMTLRCTLTIPDTSKKPPIIITLNGFTGDRNDLPVLGTDVPAWKWLSKRLAEQGFASLRIDFRGSGDSDGDYSMTTFSTQISDAVAAIDYIENNLKHQVNTESIGIFGFSQGGLVGSVTAARDKRVDSLVLWSAPAYPSHDYEGLLTKEGIKQGLALPQGGTITLGLYLDGTYFGNVDLGKGFFEDLFNVGPLAEIADYKGPMMYVAGNQDIIVWPQPNIGETFLKYHKGDEKLVELNAGHSFVLEGPEKMDDASFWSIAWFIKTLKEKE